MEPVRRDHAGEDAAARKALEIRAQKEDLSARELHTLAVEAGSGESAEQPEIVAQPRGLFPAKSAPIRRPPLRLNTYSLPASPRNPRDLSSLLFPNNDLLSRGLAIRMVET